MYTDDLASKLESLEFRRLELDVVGGVAFWDASATAAEARAFTMQK
jgi:hypothetical protein